MRKNRLAYLWSYVLGVAFVAVVAPVTASGGYHQTVYVRNGGSAEVVVYDNRGQELYQLPANDRWLTDFYDRKLTVGSVQGDGFVVMPQIRAWDGAVTVWVYDGGKYTVTYEKAQKQ